MGHGGAGRDGTRGGGACPRRRAAACGATPPPEPRRPHTRAAGGGRPDGGGPPRHAPTRRGWRGALRMRGRDAQLWGRHPSRSVRQTAARRGGGGGVGGGRLPTRLISSSSADRSRPPTAAVGITARVALWAAGAPDQPLRPRRQHWRWLRARHPVKFGLPTRQPTYQVAPGQFCTTDQNATCTSSQALYMTCSWVCKSRPSTTVPLPVRNQT